MGDDTGRKSTGEWICMKLMRWLGEMRPVTFEDIIVKSNNDSALTSF